MIAFNAAIPGRAKLASKYESAKKREQLKETLKGAAKKTAIGAGVVGLGGLGAKIFGGR